MPAKKFGPLLIVPETPKGKKTHDPAQSFRKHEPVTVEKPKAGHPQPWSDRPVHGDHSSHGSQSKSRDSFQNIPSSFDAPKTHYRSSFEDSKTHVRPHVPSRYDVPEIQPAFSPPAHAHTVVVNSDEILRKIEERRARGENNWSSRYEVDEIPPDVQRKAQERIDRHVQAREAEKVKEAALIRDLKERQALERAKHEAIRQPEVKTSNDDDEALIRRRAEYMRKAEAAAAEAREQEAARSEVTHEIGPGEPVSSEEEDVLVSEIVKMMNEERDEFRKHHSGSGSGNSWTHEEIHDVLAELRARKVHMTPSVQAKVIHSLLWRDKPSVKSDPDIFSSVEKLLAELVDTVTSQAGIVIDSAPSDKAALKHKTYLVLAEIRELTEEIESELEKARQDESLFPKGHVELVRMKRRLAVYQENMENAVVPSDDGLREFHGEITRLLHYLYSLERDLDEALEDERTSLKKHTKEMERQQSWLDNDRKKLKELFNEKREIADELVEITDELHEIQDKIESQVEAHVELEAAKKQEREIIAEMRELQRENKRIEEEIRRKEEEAAQEQRELEERSRREEEAAQEQRELEERNRASSHEESYNLARKEFFDRVAAKFREVVAGVRYSREHETAEVLARSLARQQLREAVEDDDALNRYMHDFVDRSCIPMLMRASDQAFEEIKREINPFLFALVEPAHVRGQSPEPDESGRSSSVPLISNHPSSIRRSRSRSPRGDKPRDASEKSYGHSEPSFPSHSGKSYDPAAQSYYGRSSGGDSNSHDVPGSPHSVPEISHDHDVPIFHEPEVVKSRVRDDDEFDAPVDQREFPVMDPAYLRMAGYLTRLSFSVRKFLVQTVEVFGEGVRLYELYSGDDAYDHDRAALGDVITRIKVDYISKIEITVDAFARLRSINWRAFVDELRSFVNAVRQDINNEKSSMSSQRVIGEQHTLAAGMYQVSLLECMRQFRVIEQAIIRFASKADSNFFETEDTSCCLGTRLGTLSRESTSSFCKFIILQRMIKSIALKLINDIKPNRPLRRDLAFFQDIISLLDDRYLEISSGDTSGEIDPDSDSRVSKMSIIKARIRMVLIFFYDVYHEELVSRVTQRPQVGVMFQLTSEPMNTELNLGVESPSIEKTRADQLRSTPLLYKAWLEASDPP